MKVRILGAHNTESLNTRMMSLLIDNVLALDAGGLTSGLSFAAQQKVRAVLLTHYHYDHIRDIPALAMNAFLEERTINLYTTQAVYDVLVTHVLNGVTYPNFFTRPPEKPTINFMLMEPYRTKQIAGYEVTAVPVTHAVPAVGYQVVSPDGKTIFYTGDAGPGISDCWRHIAPRVLFIEVTASNRWEGLVREVGHLTPALLEQELTGFREQKGYLPDVVAIHMNPREEAQIKLELAAVAQSLNTSVTLARERMVLRV